MADDELIDAPPGRIPPWSDLEELSKVQGNAVEVALEEHALKDKTLAKICEQAFEKIGQELPGYEMREEQVQMAQQILRSFYRERSVVIEAATGVGKSFAYMVASLAFNYLTGERVLIATETKALQWQLYQKDLPFLKRALDKSLRFELCLGSSNYYCRLRYEDMLRDGTFRDSIDDAALQQLRDWANDVILDPSRSGSRFEDAPRLPEAIWSLVTRDSDGCTAQRCPHYATCNYYRERKKWAEAQILVANHHLLLYHLLNDKRTLPEYGAVVIDEAHGLIKTGYSIFTASFGRHEFQDFKKHADKTLLQHTGIQGEEMQEAIELLSLAQERWENFFSRWEVECDLTFKENGTTLIRSTLADSPELAEPLRELAEKFEKLKEDDLDAALQANVNAQAKQLQKMTSFAKDYDKPTGEDTVYWAEKRNEKFYLHACRLNLGETLADLMPELRLYTSATIGYWPFGNFPKFKSELVQKGFFNRFLTEALPKAEEGSIDCNIFFSPFNYREHAALYAPEHLLIPEHGAPPEVLSDYFDLLSEEIRALVETSHGGALVLFTSNYYLNQVKTRLRESTDIPIFSQLEDGAQDALAKFRNDKESVLLGSQSFWQGIDVAGDGLRLLIITKLLFTPPDDPIFKARSDRLEAQGKKPFFDLSLPHASTMLRQAFGRLIRTEKDRGVVALLDSRIWQKTYGKTLLANLPRVNILHSFAELMRANEESRLFDYSKE